MISQLSRLLAAAMLLGALSGLIANLAQAATDSSRIAQITSLTGDVFVKKSGGTKEFKAYVNMTLNQGDYLRTGSKSSVVLKVLDREDELTFDANASVFLSQLKTSGNDKKTNVTMWSGSVYARASTLVGGDELEIETPTAVMGVRGTNFILSVNSYGDTSLFVSSGVVQGLVKPAPKTAPTEPAQPAAHVYPTMQAFFAPGTDGTTPPEVSIIDPASFTANAGPAIIQALIQNASQIRQENEEFLRSLMEQMQSDDRSGNLPPDLEVDSLAGVSRLSDNLSNIVSVLANNAINSGILTKEQVEEIIKQVNAETSAGIQLSNNVDLDLSEQQLAAQEALRRKEQQRREQQQQQQQQREQEQQSYSSLLTQLQQRQQQLQEQNERAAAQKSQDAEERYKSTMTEEERRAYEERVQSRTQDRSQPPAPPASPSAPPTGGDGTPPTPPPTVQVPDQTRSTVHTTATFDAGTKLTGADILIELVDTSGNPIRAVNSFVIQVSRDGSPVAALNYDATKPANSNAYRFAFKPTEAGSYTLTPIVRVTAAASAVGFAALNVTSEAPGVSLAAATDASGAPIPGAFDLVLNGVSGIRGLEAHVLADAYVSPDHVETDADDLFNERSIEHMTVVYGRYDGSDKPYSEIIYAVIPNGDAEPTGNDVGPYTLLRVTQIYGSEPVRVKIGKMNIVLADGSVITISGETEITPKSGNE